MISNKSFHFIFLRGGCFQNWSTFNTISINAVLLNPFQNPVGVSMSIYDDVCHAFNKSSARTSMQSQQNYASTNFPMRFRRTPEVSEQYERYESSLLVHEQKEVKVSSQ